MFTGVGAVEGGACINDVVDDAMVTGAEIADASVEVSGNGCTVRGVGFWG